MTSFLASDIGFWFPLVYTIQYRACVVDLPGLGIMCGVHDHVYMSLYSVYKPT